MQLPETVFFLFGMGNRPKFLYRRGQLIDLLSGKLIKEWQNIESEEIFPDLYEVHITLPENVVIIKEDEKGVWLQNAKDAQRVNLIDNDVKYFVNLPSFQEHKHAKLLKVLHHELLINIVDTQPVPNLLVYPRPWYRDAAMVCMVLARTDNLHLVRDWILALTEPFDRNNKGHCEPDNLGQVLYMISLVSDANHPLVTKILTEAARLEKDGYILGLTDYAQHPVFQTKWLKFGLTSLGLPDSYTIPSDLPDSYSTLFWMAYQSSDIPVPRFDKNMIELYPYLGWAQAHSLTTAGSSAADFVSSANLPYNSGYPVTWEAEASEANYEAMRTIDERYVLQRIAAPHSWHGAEMFLYLSRF
jgi:hypothetical protein